VSRFPEKTSLYFCLSCSLRLILPASMCIAHFRQELSTLTEAFIYDYVVEMYQQGGDTHFATLRRVNEDSRPFSNVTVVERPSRWHPRRLWHRALVPFSERKPLHAEWPLVRDRLEEALREIQPDLVHAHFGPAGIIIAPVANPSSSAIGCPTVKNVDFAHLLQGPSDRKRVLLRASKL